MKGGAQSPADRHVQRLIARLGARDAERAATAAAELRRLAEEKPPDIASRLRQVRAAAALARMFSDAGEARAQYFADIALAAMAGAGISAPTIEAEAHTAAALAAWTTDPTGSERHCRLAVAALDPENDDHHRVLVDALDRHALRLQTLDDNTAAMATYARALALAERLGQRPAIRQILRRMANTAQDLGQFDLALDRMASARPERGATAAERLSWRHAMALLHERLVELDKAEHHYDACVRLFEDHQHRLAPYVAALTNAGQLKADRGHLGSAELLLDYAQRWQTATPGESYRVSRWRLQAKIARGRDGVDAALVLLKAARRDVAESGASASSSQSLLLLGAEMLVAERREDDAIAWLVDGLDLSDGAERPLAGAELPGALLLGVLLLRRGEMTPSSWIVRQGIAAAGQIEDAHVEAMALAGAAEIESLAGRPHNAIVIGKLAASLTLASLRPLGADTLDAATYLMVRRDAIHGLERRLVAAGRLPERRQLVAALRLRQSLELGNRGPEPAEFGGLIGFTDSERRFVDRYVSLVGRMRALAAQYVDWKTDEAERPALATGHAALEAELAALFDAGLEPLPPPPSPPSLAAAFSRATRGEDVATLRFHQGEDETLLEASIAGESRYHRIGFGHAALADRISALTDAILANENALPAGQALFRDLLGPVDAALRGCRIVECAVDGAMAHLPFAALHDGTHYLAQRHVLRYRSGVEARAIPAWQPPERIAAFGLSTAHSGYSPLPHVPAELSSIKAKFARAVRSARNARFTSARLAAELAAHPDIVHIASHFRLVPGSPASSRLLLGGGKTLSAAEVTADDYAWQGVRLVFLSACETGADGAEGETLASLLHRRGVNWVVATLWPVADHSAAGLAASFYAALAGGMEPGEALQQAQLAALRDGADLGWASFKAFVPGA